MELLLNLLWLVIAFSAFAVWRRRHVCEDGAAESQTRRGWIALACALVLLFFAISLTDDLHAEVVLVEDSTFSKRHLCAAHSLTHSTGGKLPCLHAFVLPCECRILPSTEFVGFVPDRCISPACTIVRAVPGRSPPPVSL